jgi:hypothetical protein
VQKKMKKRNLSPDGTADRGNPPSLAVHAKQPSLKKRRSLRLGGLPVSLPAEQKPTSETTPGSESRYSRRLEGQAHGAQLSASADPTSGEPSQQMQEDEGTNAQIDKSTEEMRHTALKIVTPEIRIPRAEIAKEIDMIPHEETSEAGILASLRNALGSLRTATLGKSTLREIDDIMFDIRVEAHEAARRYGA